MDSLDLKASLSRVSGSKFPAAVLHWLKNNIPAKGYINFAKTCSFFKGPVPFFFIDSLYAGRDYDDEIEYYNMDEERFKVRSIEDIPDNLWIADRVSSEMPIRSFFISQLIPKIAVCKAKSIYLADEEIFKNEFKVLTASGKVKHLSLRNSIILDEHHRMVSMEYILDCVPAIVDLLCHENVPSFESIDNAKKYIVPRLSACALCHITNDFDAAAFIEFMKNHRRVAFTLKYQSTLAYSRYTKMLQKYVDEFVEDIEADIHVPWVTLPKPKPL